MFQDWDGKTTTSLKAVADQLLPADYDDLLAACRSSDKTTARAASWVLKAAYEKGADIAYPSDLLSRDLHWEVALHLLQSVQYVTADVPPVMVAPYLTHKKVVVRAWALDAYVRLGGPDTANLLRMAANDPAASIRARARNLSK